MEKNLKKQERTIKALKAQTKAGSNDESSPFLSDAEEEEDLKPTAKPMPNRKNSALVRQGLKKKPNRGPG